MAQFLSGMKSIEEGLAIRLSLLSFRDGSMFRANQQMRLSANLQMDPAAETAPNFGDPSFFMVLPAEMAYLTGHLLSQVDSRCQA